MIFFVLLIISIAFYIYGKYKTSKMDRLIDIKRKAMEDVENYYQFLSDNYHNTTFNGNSLYDTEDDNILLREISSQELDNLHGLRSKYFDAEEKVANTKKYTGVFYKHDSILFLLVFSIVLSASIFAVQIGFCIYNGYVYKDWSNDTYIKAQTMEKVVSDSNIRNDVESYFNYLNKINSSMAVFIVPNYGVMKYKESYFELAEKYKVDRIKE